MSKLYQTIMGVQSNLDYYQPESPQQQIIRTEGMQQINEEWTPHKRLVKTKRMLFIPDGLSQLNDDTVEFEEATITANVPGLVIAKIGIRQIVSLRCFETVVLGPSLELEPSLVDLEMESSNANTVLRVGERIRRPIYIPAEDVTFISLAA